MCFRQLNRLTLTRLAMSTPCVCPRLRDCAYFVSALLYLHPGQSPTNALSAALKQHNRYRETYQVKTGSPVSKTLCVVIIREIFGVCNASISAFVDRMW